MYFSLLKREIDIAITVEKPRLENVISRKLTNYRLGLFARKEYLEDRPKITSEADLGKHSMISYIENMIFDPSLKFMDEFFPWLKPSLKCSTVIAQRNAVLSACGIGIIPYFLLTSKQNLVPVLPDLVIEREYWLTVHPDSRGFARVQAIIDFIVSHVEADVELFMSLPNT
jgi:DNA-binding transcriptional LysR family regulator